PPLGRGSQERDHPRVHHGDLAIRVGVAAQPPVTDQAGSGVEARFGEGLTFVHRRSPGDEHELAVVCRGAPDLVEAVFQCREVKMHTTTVATGRPSSQAYSSFTGASFTGACMGTLRDCMGTLRTWLFPH